MAIGNIDTTISEVNSVFAPIVRAIAQQGAATETTVVTDNVRQTTHMPQKTKNHYKT